MANSSLSWATYSSPALVAACWAASRTRTTSGVSWGCPAPSPLTFGCLASSASTAVLAADGIAAGGADQAGGSTFLIVEQRLEDVLGGDALVEVADRDGVGSLQEAARPLGEFLDVHSWFLSL